MKYFSFALCVLAFGLSVSMAQAAGTSYYFSVFNRSAGDVALTLRAQNTRTQNVTIQSDSLENMVFDTTADSASVTYKCGGHERQVTLTFRKNRFNIRMMIEADCSPNFSYKT